MPIINITLYDNYNEKYMIYPNVWLPISVLYDEGTLKLQNYYFKMIIIPSISSWKTTF